MKYANNQLVEGQRGRFDTLPPEEGLVSDMSWALGMHTDFAERRGYQGWYDQVPIGNPPPEPENDYQKWTSDMWESLGEGDTLGTAFGFAYDQQTNTTDPNAPASTYRFKGQGNIPNINLVATPW